MPDDDTKGPTKRHKPRTAMFVAADCLTQSAITPVRIRNLSPDGALLEGAVLPAEGETFELIRGALRVRGRVLRAHGDQCGVAFAELIDVAQWMARTVPAHQRLVGTMVQQAPLDAAAARPAAAIASDALTGPGVANVRAAIVLLDALEDALADDPLLVARHLDRLQALDRALQLLRAAVPPAA